jgi:hypothetical protein
MFEFKGALPGDKCHFFSFVAQAQREVLLADHHCTEMLQIINSPGNYGCAQQTCGDDRVVLDEDFIN